MKIDKRNGDCCFNEETHTYWNEKDPNKKYISVTTMIEHFTETFNTEFWSRFKALERLVGGVDTFKGSVARKLLLETKVWNPTCCQMCKVNEDDLESVAEEIRAEYKRNNKEACDFGTNYHLEQEMKFYKQPTFNLQEFNPRFNGEFECKKDYYELDLPFAIYPEYLVYWENEEGDFRVSGQVDLVIKEQLDISIIDHKTNAKGIEKESFYNPKTRSRKMLKFPLTHIQDCNLMHYTLQLSTYAWMLKKINPEFNIKLLMLSHCDREGKITEYEVEYRPDDVERMLKETRKRLYIEEQRNKRNGFTL